MPIVNVKRFSRDKRLEAPIEAETEPINEVETPATSVVPYEPSNETLDFSDLGRQSYEREIAKAAEEVQRLADEKERLKMQKREEKERAAEEKKQRAAMKKLAVVSKRKTTDDDDSSVFNETGSEIIGRDKRILLQKIQQYKQLFPTELKAFKVKRNATTEELKAYIDEMSSIIEIGTLDEFISESILHTVKLVEGVSSMTQNYNLTGLADMLRVNPQFSKLVKQLYIKYNSFENVPPEYQLALLVATTSYVCVQKNRNKSQLTAYLNTPYNAQQNI